MWISALAAMILKYAEITLSVSHRRKRGDENHGGAMFYFEDAFESKGKKKFGKAVGWIFAALCAIVSFGIGCMMQVNAVSSSFFGVFSVPEWIIGIILAIMTAVVITKGARGISKLTEWLVPIMSLGYIVMSVAVMVVCRDRLPEAFESIIKGAFTFESSVGGVVGFLFSDAVRYGAMRGLLSNEAGCGTAAFAHAASNATEPAKQGTWGIFEVFVDTIILCTMTALVIILNYDEAVAYSSNGIMMTVKAYSAVLGRSAEYFLCAAILLFAYATVICWAHYGIECATYMFSRKKKAAASVYAAAFCVAAFLGAVVAPAAVWSLADFAIGSMTIMNVIIIISMSGKVRSLTGKYFSKR
jgi:AGCS family alanine or glycine:cation symporter